MRILPAGVMIGLLFSGWACGETKMRTYEDQREVLVDRTIEGRGITNQLVLGAMRTVPREEFVPDGQKDLAHGDHPLPIGHGQTISQPYIVAYMSDKLGLEPGDKVLEVGTGSGYQAAILAEMGMEVYSIEIIPELAEQARKDLARTGYESVSVKTGDGFFGWPEHAPFDAIIVTAAARSLPDPLVEQLAVGGDMVLPVGPPGGVQELILVQKPAEGDIRQSRLLPVQFVPLTGGHE